MALFGSLNHSLVLYGALEGLHLGCEVHYLEGQSPTKQLEYLERENIEILYHDLDVLNLNRKHSLLIDSYDEDFIKRFYNLSKNIKVFALNDNFFNSPFSNVDLHIDFIINIIMSMTK